MAICGANIYFFYYTISSTKGNFRFCNRFEIGTFWAQETGKSKEIFGGLGDVSLVPHIGRVSQLAYDRRNIQSLL